MKLDSKMSNDQRYKISKSCLGKKIGNKNAAKPILQFDMNNNFIKSWDSVTQAANGVKRAVCSIALCAQGLVKHSAGFKWKYKYNKKE